MVNSIRWTSPSNIAIVKYWGKYGVQFPMNPSLSFTLSACKTDTIIEWTENINGAKCSVEFYYDGKIKPEFEVKIKKFISTLEIDLTWLKKLQLKINSMNSFPHSAGIASSASAMSALALCLISIENEYTHRTINEELFYNRASKIARLGSGSAARSVYPVASIWGEFAEVANTSNEYAIPYHEKVHTDFHTIMDCIFIVNKNEKSVSSSAGHQLMESHPYKHARILQANRNMHLLVNALVVGDWPQFASVCEEEALSLHGLMMSSNPGYLLLEPESVKILSLIKTFRKETKLPLAFTIDAGPNIHLLYPKEIQDKVCDWIHAELPEYWKEKKLIFDTVGSGPQKISIG